MTLTNFRFGLDRAALAARADEARRISELLKLLGHENRLLILCALAEGERSVSELETILAMSQAAVSQQLARLRSSGLVTTRRSGRMIYYSLRQEAVVPAIGQLYDVFCRREADSSSDPGDG